VLVSLRAGIVVTGTEVLTGLIADRNGPWLSEQLRERGVQAAHIVVVGDRPADVRAALEFLARERVALIVTSGGLGPTADDLTAEVVAGFAGRELVLDAALEERIRRILERLRGRWRRPIDEEAMRAGNRKQALVPVGATVLEPVGTAPGLVVEPAPGRDVPPVLVLPGPPGELQPMWRDALTTPAMERALAGAGVVERRIVRMYGIPESELAQVLREIDADRLDLEITTCLRRGELEVATMFSPGAEKDYEKLLGGLRGRFASIIFSEDGATIDEVVAGALRAGGWTIATAESCTGGLLSARLTELPGSSDYVLGGIAVYSNAAKTALAGVDASLIERFGAVSPEVAMALADGSIARFGARVGVGITGVAGPGGGTEAKPVGTVCLSVARADGPRIDRTVALPGGRVTVRDRSTTVALHLLRRLLAG
jgi:nicotinamide-nucleotide amidase